MLLWFTLTLFSVGFVVWDSVFNGVTSWVQRAAWILVTLYTGPIGVFMYLLACRRPFPGGHDRYTAKTWKQAMNSEMHCLAGDATGIIIAASIVPVFHLANGWDLMVEYSAGFISGLFIFQALMMAGMYGGDYFKAVRKTIFAETVSMNMVMTGMIPTMVILAALWPDTEDPLQPAFWFKMSMASIVGGLFAFPINYWLVSNHLKHGCMTLPGADGPAPGLGHQSPEKSSTHAAMDMADEMPMGDSHATMKGMDSMEHGSQQQGGAAMHADRDMDHGVPGGDGGGSAPQTHAEHGMKMTELSMATSLAWVTATFALLIGAIWLTAQWVPISFG
jgi:hypothetical protein